MGMLFVAAAAEQRVRSIIAANDGSARVAVDNDDAANDLAQAPRR